MGNFSEPRYGVQIAFYLILHFDLQLSAAIEVWNRRSNGDSTVLDSDKLPVSGKMTSEPTFGEMLGIAGFERWSLLLCCFES